MAFTIQDALDPTSIGQIDHYLDDGVGQSLSYRFEILDQFGDEMKIRYGDEAPHLTPEQITLAQNFIANRRANIPTNRSWNVGDTVGRTTWRLRDVDGVTRTFHCRAVQLDSQGAVVQVDVFDDEQYLTAGQVAGLESFMATQRTEAEKVL